MGAWETVLRSNLNCADMARDVSEEKTISKWPRDCFCDVLAKNIAAFCPCPKHLHEITLKSLQLRRLAEISREPCFDCVLWLLVTTVMQIYIEKYKKKCKF